MYVWECDLVNVRALGKYNDKYVYILFVIDVFSKFQHLVPLRSKTGTAVSSAFQSILRTLDTKHGFPFSCEQIKAKKF